MNKVPQSPCPCTHDADIPVRESDKQVSKYRVFEMGMGWEGGERLRKQDSGEEGGASERQRSWGLEGEMRLGYLQIPATQAHPTYTSLGHQCLLGRRWPWSGWKTCQVSQLWPLPCWRRGRCQWTLVGKPGVGSEPWPRVLVARASRQSIRSCQWNILQCLSYVFEFCNCNKWL